MSATTLLASVVLVAIVAVLGIGGGLMAFAGATAMNSKEGNKLLVVGTGMMLAAAAIVAAWAG